MGTSLPATNSPTIDVENLVANTSDTVITPSQRNYLNDIWSVYYHDFSNDWDIKSYVFIANISNVESFCELFKCLNSCWYSGTFFIFREHIMPRWEDEYNVDGGCFSIKIPSNEAEEKWFNMCASVLGETMGVTSEYSSNINGISITPKKNSNLLRVWLKDNDLADSDFYKINMSKYSTILYKKHIYTN